MHELDEIFVRNQIRVILKEQMEDVTWGDIMPPSADEFYNTFIGPFVDVFKVAQVAVKDVTAATLLTIQAVMTFDLEKKRKLQEKFRADREKYKGEMTAAMKTTDEALSSPDAQLLMFMMNPGAYMGAGLTREVAQTAEPVTDFLGDKLGGFGEMMGLGSGTGAAAVGQAGSGKGPIRGIIDDMKALFFGESVDEIDELERVLREGGDEEKKKDDIDVEEALDKWLEESGAGEKIEGYAKTILDNKKQEVEAVKAEYKGIIDGLTAIQKAVTFEELAQLIPELTAAGLDLKEQVAAAEKAATEQKAALEEGNDEAIKILEDLKKHPDAKGIAEDAPVAEYFPLIDQGIIAATFSDVVTQAKQEGVGDLLGFVAEMTRDELEDLAKSGSTGKQYADLVLGLEEELLSM